MPTYRGKRRQTVGNTAGKYLEHILDNGMQYVADTGAGVFPPPAPPAPPPAPLPQPQQFYIPIIPPQPQQPQADIHEILTNMNRQFTAQNHQMSFMMQNVVKVIDEHNRRTESWFSYILRHPFRIIFMFMLSIFVVGCCLYAWNYSIKFGCELAQQQLKDATTRNDWGSAELYSTQVSKLCGMNNKIRIAIFDSLNSFLDSLHPERILASIFKGAFKWMTISQ